MLPKKLRPYSVDDLIRLGNKSDGGYVVSKKIIENTKTLLTFGLSDEFSFEKNFKKLKPDLKVLVFDHLTTKSFWIKNCINWIFHFVRNRKNFSRIFKYFEYKKFFNLNDVKHYQKKIVSYKRKEPNSISIDEIIKENEIVCETTFLKMNIEMDEYRILDDIANKNFLGIIIEFYNIDLNLDKILNFLESNNKMSIIHVHANNFVNPDENGDPVQLDITFLNTEIINLNKKFSDLTYPVKNLDYPDDKKKSDISISFLEN